jgi:chaperone required for assembly of F1-ATPase
VEDAAAVKRFYKTVGVEAEGGGWRVVLDGRGIRTVSGGPQVVPSRKLAKAMAAEWEAQGDQIDPAAFMLRDLADYAIDVVAPDPQAASSALLPFAETDTLCYRAEPDEALNERQCAVWDPLIAACEARLDVHFERVAGIVHRPQPDATLARLAAEVARLDPFALSALRTLTSLAASLIIGLAALEREADPFELWNAANLEEDWQAELWGKDAEALARRDQRFAAFAATMRFAELARGEP